MPGRLALLIDGPNLHHTAKNLGFDVDYKLLLKEFSSRGELIRAYYFTPIVEGPNSVRPLTDWLEYNGYSVRAKPVGALYDGRSSARLNRIGVDMTIDAFEIAPFVNEVYLFSGDGDLRRIVEAVQRLGPKVTVVSSFRTTPAMISDQLRRQADHFLELDTIRGSIARSPRPDSNL